MQAGSVNANKISDKEVLRNVRRPYVWKYRVLAVVLVLLCVVSLPIGATAYAVYDPADVVGVMGKWLQVTGDALFANKHYTTQEIMDQWPMYYQVLARMGITLISALCGAMLALSGSLYQMVFRNPIAAPTMLGVGNGVTLGIVVLVVLYGSAAPYMTAEHYLLCYTGAIVVLAVVVGASLLVNRGKLVTVDMLLMGTMVSALVGQVVLFFTYVVFDTQAWDVYNALNEVLRVNTEPLSYIVLAVVFLVSVVPMLLIRFKLNVIAFDSDDVHASGVSQSRLVVVALVCATIMVVAAQVHVGTVSMMALVVPFAARKIFGAEFSRQIWGNLLLGAIFVVACNDITALVDTFFVSCGLDLEFPAGLVANVVAIPLFAWIIASQQKAWD